MLASVGGILLGLLVGLRHAFEPDHLTAVSTLVVEAGDARRGTLLGMVWGIGHTTARDGKLGSCTTTATAAAASTFTPGPTSTSTSAAGRSRCGP
jgi:high-affinity nickel permease